MISIKTKRTKKIASTLGSTLRIQTALYRKQKAYNKVCIRRAFCLVFDKESVVWRFAKYIIMRIVPKRCSSRSQDIDLELLENSEEMFPRFW